MVALFPEGENNLREVIWCGLENSSKIGRSMDEDEKMPVPSCRSQADFVSNKVTE